VDFDYRILIQRLAERCGRPAPFIAQLVDQSPLLMEYESGAIGTREFFDQVRAAAGFPGDLGEFAELFGDIFTPIEPMVALQQELRAAGYPTYILSNTNELAVRWITRQFPFFSEFDGYIYSYEQRAMKPGPRIYEVVEEMAARRGPALIYIDDREENLVTAKSRGWRVILQADPKQTRAEVVEMTGLGRS
jgi:FMN phosphatase YigB (HAD superfamily)